MDYELFPSRFTLLLQISIDSLTNGLSVVRSLTHDLLVIGLLTWPLVFARKCFPMLFTLNRNCQIVSDLRRKRKWIRVAGRLLDGAGQRLLRLVLAGQQDRLVTRQRSETEERKWKFEKKIIIWGVFNRPLDHQRLR